MIEIEKLLQPISEQSPCGEDISYDPRFLELATLIAGKPETQFSASEEPDWKGICDACLELFERSKHLRVSITLGVALVKLEGATGLRDGLALLKGLIENYWQDVYPALDPEEDNDPTERVNIIASLSTPLGTFGDPIKFLQRAREMPLAISTRMGRFSLAEIEGGRSAGPGGEGAAPASPAEISAAFQDTDPAQLQATGAAIADSIALVKDIDRLLMDKAGAGRAPEMGQLLATLNEIQKCIAPHLAASEAPAAAQDGAAHFPASGPGAPAADGVIRSRQDVMRVLDKICAYYALAEPSSPVPLLLRRAKRLVDMSFLEVIAELTPEASGPLQVIVGQQPAAGSGGSSE